MKTIRNYNIYVFISTFTRNIIDVYSVIYLYELGFPIKAIISIYALVYFLGYFISSLSIHLGNKFGYRYILIMSSFFTGISFYIIHNVYNYYLIVLCLSLSIFTYHPVRHYYGIRLLDNKKKIGNILIYTYMATLLSSYMVMKDINMIYLVILVIISIIPVFFIENDKDKSVNNNYRLNKQKLKFFFFDQFRIIFILLEPLYLYMIANTISYVGIFNIILTISSVLWIYFISRKINIYKNYKYINILFTIVLLLKLSLHNKYFLLIIAFLEGIGIKSNELVSTMNLYSDNKLDSGYIIRSEKIFCMTRALILSIIYFLSRDLKITLYILLIGIFCLSFIFYEKENTSI